MPSKFLKKSLKELKCCSENIYLTQKKAARKEQWNKEGMTHVSKNEVEYQM